MKKKFISAALILSLASAGICAAPVSAEWEQTEAGYSWINEDGSAQKGWVTVDGKSYYIGKDGVTLHGMAKIGGKLYYFSKDDEGSAFFGLMRIKGKLYYFRSPEKGGAASGWTDINGKRYYFGKDGYAVTGLVKIGNDRYYFDEKGVMQTGLIYVGELVYDLGEDGKLKTSYEGEEKEEAAAEPAITWDMSESAVKKAYKGCNSFKKESMLIVQTESGLKYFIFDKDSKALTAYGNDSPFADKTDEFSALLESEGYTLKEKTDMHKYATLIYEKDGAYAAVAGNGKSSILLYASPALAAVFEAGGTEALIKLAAANGLSIE